jgi:Fe-Mn family superoxide dismutase
MMDELETLLETLDEAKPKIGRPLNTGLSQKQIMQHYDDLYMGYIKKLRQIKSRLKDPRRPSADPSFSDYRALKKEESYVVNAIRLHELYFGNIGYKAKGTENHTNFRDALKANGNWRWDEWKRDFAACARSARGWAIAVYDTVEKKICNITMDSHDIGFQVGCVPLLVCDVYEHAYFTDFGSDRDKYFEWFMEHVNWSEVMTRVNDVIPSSLNG